MPTAYLHKIISSVELLCREVQRTLDQKRAQAALTVISKPPCRAASPVRATGSPVAGSPQLPTWSASRQGRSGGDAPALRDERSASSCSTVQPPSLHGTSPFASCAHSAATGSATPRASASSAVHTVTGFAAPSAARTPKGAGKRGSAKKPPRTGNLSLFLAGQLDEPRDSSPAHAAVHNSTAPLRSEPATVQTPPLPARSPWASLNATASQVSMDLILAEALSPPTAGLACRSGGTNAAPPAPLPPAPRSGGAVRGSQKVQMSLGDFMERRGSAAAQRSQDALPGNQGAARTAANSSAMSASASTDSRPAWRTATEPAQDAASTMAAAPSLSDIMQAESSLAAAAAPLLQRQHSRLSGSTDVAGSNRHSSPALPPRNPSNPWGKPVAPAAATPTADLFIPQTKADAQRRPAGQWSGKEHVPVRVMEAIVAEEREAETRLQAQAPTDSGEAGTDLPGSAQAGGDRSEQHVDTAASSGHRRVQGQNAPSQRGRAARGRSSGVRGGRHGHAGAAQADGADATHSGKGDDGKQERSRRRRPRRSRASGSGQAADSNVEASTASAPGGNECKGDREPHASAARGRGRKRSNRGQGATGIGDGDSAREAAAAAAQQPDEAANLATAATQGSKLGDSSPARSSL